VTLARRIAGALFVFALIWSLPARGAERLVVWCAYTGQEQQGLRAALAAFEREHGVGIDLLSIPFGAYMAKLEAAIPTGNGPDLFIDAHERLPVFVSRELVQPWPDQRALAGLVPQFSAALSFEGRPYGAALAVKSLALYVNEALVPAARLETTADLRALQQRLPHDVVPLVFESENPYYVAPFLHAFSGELLSPAGQYAFVGAPAARTLDLLRVWTETGLVPHAPSGDLVKRMFVNGQAATAVSGPWLAADLPPELRYHIEPLPRLSENSGAALEPYVTVEGAFVARTAQRRYFH